MRRSKRSSSSSATRAPPRRSRISATSSPDRKTAECCKKARWMRRSGAAAGKPASSMTFRPARNRSTGSCKARRRSSAAASRPCWRGETGQTERKGRDIMPDLIETIEDGVATLTFNRPERMNALSTPIMEGLLHGLPRLAGDPAVRVVVLTGAGRAFCAGGDVKSMAEGGVQRSVAEATAHLRSRMEVSRILHELPKPTIAMINGPAAGAGLAFALACDLRIAGATARLVTAFVKVGFSGDFGGSFFLTRLVGTAKARELYFTGRPVDAQEALSLGLVNRVVPDDQLGDTTMELARSLAQGPQIALSLMKRNLNCAESSGLAELLDLEAANQVLTGRTEDHREAAKAFVEKRAPVFVGR